VEFEDALRDLGFAFARRGRAGETYAYPANPYLTYYVQDPGDGTVLFTWEFALGEWAAGLGLQVGSDEHLNTFLFPKQDARGPREAGWVSEQMDLVEERLRAVSFLDAAPEM
jgi:hypothetical protein